jgi:archaemetzincin
MQSIISTKTGLLIFTFLFLSLEVFAQEKIYILPLGEIDEEVIQYLKNKIPEVFSLEVEVCSPKKIPLISFNPKRRQYHSSLILEELSKEKLKGYTLAICDVDLYVEGLNFVFGEANPLNKICIISLTRLRQEYYGLSKDNNLFLLRSLKEAIHELGHIFGLSHCPDPKCVMHFSNCLLDTDKKDFNFCSLCKRKLKDVHR